MKMRFLLSLALLAASACQTKVSEEQAGTLGEIERKDPALDRIIGNDARIEILSDGYEWSEGPVWVEAQKMLLFSDVPMNTVYKWTEEDSVDVFLRPSGYTGDTPSNSPEEGSNGLALSADGQLILCQHGDRRLALLDAPFSAPQPTFVTLADRYDGKRFNSPNDVAVRRNGDCFFTDPPYGLAPDAIKEIPFQGVYKWSAQGVTLLVDSLTRPNGIAFMPEERTVVIANSDPDKAVWYAYDVTDDDQLTNGRIFYDATENTKNEPGLPDGLKIDRQGNVFATGPGGVWIFDREGTVLGRIKLPVATANCAFSADEKTLYITADNYLLRLKMRS